MSRRDLQANDRRDARSIPAAPGRKARHDYEYERNGVANLFMMFAPLEGWRCVKVTDRHAAVDYAHALKDLSDKHFPDAAKIVLVQDNLSAITERSHKTFLNPRAVRPMQCLQDGWQFIKDDYWLFLGITVVGMIIAGLVPFGLLMGPCMCGIYLCLFRREAGRRVSFDMLFKGFDYFAQSVIATLIMMVPILFFLMLFYAVMFGGIIFGGTLGTYNSPGQPPSAVPVIGFLAVYAVAMMGMILTMMVVGVLFQFIFPLIVDRGLSGWEAVKLSVRAVLGNLGGLIGSSHRSVTGGSRHGWSAGAFRGGLFHVPHQFRHDHDRRPPGVPRRKAPCYSSRRRRTGRPRL